MIIEEIIQHTASAKNAASDHEKRESLSAIRALSDLALHSQMPQSLSKSSATYIQPTTVMPATPQPMNVISNQQTSSPTEGNRLQEKGANGDSIFDF